jgi:hypothetical protein
MSINPEYNSGVAIVPTISPPSNIPKELSQYLSAIIISINSAFSNVHQLQVRSTVDFNTFKPTEGKLYYFSQPVLPHITSAGYWGFSSGSWVKLG